MSFTTQRTSSAYTSTAKFITSTYFMNKNFNLFSYQSMFCTCLTDVQKLPEDELQKNETR